MGWTSLPLLETCLKLPTTSFTGFIMAKVWGYLRRMAHSWAAWGRFTTHTRIWVASPEYMPVAGTMVALWPRPVMISRAIYSGWSVTISKRIALRPVRIKWSPTVVEVKLYRMHMSTGSI